MANEIRITQSTHVDGFPTVATRATLDRAGNLYDARVIEVGESWELLPFTDLIADLGRAVFENQSDTLTIVIAAQTDVIYGTDIVPFMELLPGESASLPLSFGRYYQAKIEGISSIDESADLLYHVWER